MDVIERLNKAGVRMACDGGSRMVEARDILPVSLALRPVNPDCSDCRDGTCSR